MKNKENTTLLDGVDYVGLVEQLEAKAKYENAQNSKSILPTFKGANTKLKRNATNLLPQHFVTAANIITTSVAAVNLAHEVLNHLEYNKDSIGNSMDLILTIFKRVKRLADPESWKSIKRELLVKIRDFDKQEIPRSAQFFIDKGDLIDYKQEFKNGPPLLFGREKEISQIINALDDDELPNVFLYGPAGVGKTALAKYIMYRVANNDISSTLDGKNAYGANLCDISFKAVASYNHAERQELEIFLKQIVSENAVIFNDEFVIRGREEEAELYKDLMSKKKLSLMAATTPPRLTEFFKAIKDTDGSVKRRLNFIPIDPPDADMTYGILKHKTSHREELKGVKIPDDAIKYLVEQAPAIDGLISPARETRVFNAAISYAATNYRAKAKENPTADKVILTKLDVNFAIDTIKEQQARIQKVQKGE